MRWWRSLSVGNFIKEFTHQSLNALPRDTIDVCERGHITTAQTTLEESIATFVNRVVTYSPPPVVTSHLVIGSLLSLIEYYCFGMRRVFKTLNKHIYTISICDELVLYLYVCRLLLFCSSIVLRFRRATAERTFVVLPIF